MISDDLDYLDYARIAREVRGMCCTGCGCTWVCPHDVVKRRPAMLRDGSTMCEQCYSSPGGQSTDLVKFCMARSDELTPSEEALVTRVASLQSLDMDDYRRLAKAAARIRGTSI